MLNITFVYPDFENLGVEYLMAICENMGHKVHFVFYQTEDPYTAFKRKVINYDSIAKKIALTKPDVVIFSCITDNFRHQLDCAEALKKLNPNVFTIFGGVHVTAVPERVIKYKVVDAVSIGEGEISIPKFLSETLKCNIFVPPNKEIEGFVFKKDNVFIGTYNAGKACQLDEIPFPAKERFFKAMGYIPKEYYIITSRGCPYKCSFCYNSMGKISFRRRAVDNVIAELKWAKEKFNIKYVHFCDDSFTSNYDWIKNFCKQYKSEICLPFLCSANPLLINREIIGCLKDAGCVDVQIGVQSFSETLCKDILKRKTDNNRIKEAISMVKEAKMMVQVDHMLGIPYDTFANHEEALLFYKKVKPNLVSVFWLTYYPGTEIVNIAKEKGLLTEEDIEKIEEGYKIREGGMHSGGSVKNPDNYYGVAFLYNYLFLLPAFVVKFLVMSKLYKKIRIKSYFITTAVPRVVLSIFDRRYFTGRGHIGRFIRNISLWFKGYN